MDTEEEFNKESEMVFKSREERVEQACKVLVKTHEKVTELGINEVPIERRAFKKSVGVMTGADLHDRYFTTIATRLPFILPLLLVLTMCAPMND